MLKLLAIVAVAAVAHAISVAEHESVTNERMVSFVNSAKLSWTASADQGSLISGMTMNQARRLMGAWPAQDGPRLPRKTFPNVKVPATFDARVQWPDCWTIKQIRDQSACGSCWAFGAVEAISDRYCVSGKAANLSVSAQDMNSCCDSCGAGCGGGYPAAAWEYWARTGLVSETCDPYSLPSCDHHLANSTHPCPQNEYPTPPCVKTCKDGETWKNALHFGEEISSASGEADIQAAIFTSGPVETAFTVYADFLTYKSGVYVQKSQQAVGGHAVKFLGWGTDQASGLPYWLVANSWNADWGEQGFFRIVRGKDECGIEDEVNFGTPKS